MPRYQLIVMTNPVEGREDEFNDWYSNVHLDDVLKIPGSVGAQRYRLADLQRDGAPSPQWSYLAIYECDTDDLASIIAGLKQRSGTEAMPISSALGPDRFVYFFEPITEAKRA